MSLSLVAASSHYAVKSSFSAPGSRVVAMGCQFKANSAATQGLLTIGNAGGTINRLEIRNNLSQGVQLTDFSQGNLADQASSNTHNLAASWNSVAAAFLTPASRCVFVNGTKTSNTTDVTLFPAGLDEFLVGTRDVGGIGNYFDGLIAIVWMANDWQDSWDAMLRGGMDPRNVMGAACIHYWPLASDYTDSVGGVTLTGVNIPTFSTDQPVVGGSDTGASIRVDTPHPFVGPMALRQGWRPTPITDKTLAAVTNTEFGPPLRAVPNPFVGPMVLRRRAATNGRGWSGLSGIAPASGADENLNWLPWRNVDHLPARSGNANRERFFDRR